MAIAYSNSESFHYGIYQCVKLGLMFNADAYNLEIKLTGAY
jgi:hypothetical protein